MTAIEVFNKFVDAINRRDVDQMCRIMTEDHLFVDSLGAEYRGRETMRQGWAVYFSMVPDYAIKVKESLTGGRLVFATGIARGTYSPDGKIRPDDAWTTPAAWRAVVEGGCIATWQVYADNEPFREKFRKHEAAKS